MKNEIIKDIAILLVEDEEELRNYLLEYLQLFFVKVYAVKDGQEAYMLYLDKHPDIILTDINMPIMDGLTLIAKIRDRDKETKIIVMSAHSEEEKLLRAVELHLESYLIKPINIDKLKNILLDSVDSLRRKSKRIYIKKSVYWDNVTDTLWENSEQVLLKARETLLLKLLCSKINQSVSAESIFYTIYKDNEKKEFSSDSITSLMKRVRSKLPKDIIKNVYGAGYKIISI